MLVEEANGRHHGNWEEQEPETGGVIGLKQGWGWNGGCRCWTLPPW